MYVDSAILYVDSDVNYKGMNVISFSDGYSFSQRILADEYLAKYIQDLIQAGLVEKIDRRGVKYV